MIIEDYFEIDAGERFRYRERVPENPKATVICVHGYAEHIGRYSGIEEFFVERGFSFHIMENRGHGMSVGKKGHIDRFDQFVEDLHYFRLLVEGRAGNRPLFFLAHSNGSLISARYILFHGIGVKGLVLSGIPIRMAVKVNPIKLKVGMFLAGIIPKLTLPVELDPQVICHDKKIVDEYIADPLVHKVMSIGFGHEFLWAMEDLLERAPEFKAPVLFQHGGDDRACDPPSAKEFYENISSKDKEFMMYDGLFHEIYNEAPKMGILESAAKWMENRI